MKRLLIISPHFPPVNAADMHRVRQSVSYYKDLGWISTIVTVDPKYIEIPQTNLLSESLPADLRVIKIKAFKPGFTRKFGLGSIALRSVFFYYKSINRLLKIQQFDLIFFSTTMFPLPVLGRFWKKRFNVPYVIDMQDPWYTTYYLNKPANERPSKFWFSYFLNKYTEPFAMKKADGVIAVSTGYISELRSRYKNLTQENTVTITFGAFDKDIAIMRKYPFQNRFFDVDDSLIHIPYVGRAGFDMKKSLTAIFIAFKEGLEKDYNLFKKIRLYYIGTSYSLGKEGKKTVLPVAESIGVENYVSEWPARIDYYESLKVLDDAKMFIIPGSDSVDYTASKIYNYILLNKPILAVFHKKSSINEIITKSEAGESVQYDENTIVTEMSNKIYTKWISFLDPEFRLKPIKMSYFDQFTALELTKKQTQFFTQII